MLSIPMLQDRSLTIAGRLGTKKPLLNYGNRHYLLLIISFFIIVCGQSFFKLSVV